MYYVPTHNLLNLLRHVMSDWGTFDRIFSRYWLYRHPKDEYLNILSILGNFSQQTVPSTYISILDSILT